MRTVHSAAASEYAVELDRQGAQPSLEFPSRFLSRRCYRPSTRSGEPQPGVSA